MPVSKFVFVIGERLRAELYIAPNIYRLLAITPQMDSIINLAEILGVDNYDDTCLLRIDGPTIAKPSAIILPLSSSLPPEFLLWQEKDVLAIGAGQSVGVIKLSTGELLFAKYFPIAFYSFILAEDLDRLIVIGEIEVCVINLEDWHAWEFSVGEVLSTWSRNSSELLIIDFVGHAYKIDIVTGQFSQQ